MSGNLFICESCGGVAPDGCLKCPDRGHGTGVTVDRIKADLEAAPDRPSLEATAKHHRPNIVTLHKAGGGAKTMGIQIVNLYCYLLAGFEYHQADRRRANDGMATD